jgi:hypothetical protein
MFFDLEEIIFENFNISQNNIISVYMAKVLGYSQYAQFFNWAQMAFAYHIPQRFDKCMFVIRFTKYFKTLWTIIIGRIGIQKFVYSLHHSIFQKLGS